MIKLTNLHARKFLLRKHGLIGEHRFTAHRGVLEFIAQSGCVQYDPIDVCGRNSDLVLQSRVEGYSPQIMADLLYKDRTLIDYFDKQLAIMHVCDWPYFSRIRQGHHERGRGKDEIDAIIPEVKRIIRELGPVCSKDIGFDEKIHWYWSSTKLARAALETMYFRGDLIVHHKRGAIKYYALAEDYLPAGLIRTADPFPDELDHVKWRIRRRIGSVGLLWNKASDAWLGITTMNAELRRNAFAELIGEGEIFKCQVEGLKEPLFALKGDLPLLHEVVNGEEYAPRTEFIAPLDNLIWDRKLIRALFDFEYTWEVYVPPAKRKYGYYVLPILHGDSFIGRIDAVCHRRNNALVVNDLWYEDSAEISVKLRSSVKECLERFRHFHGLDSLRTEQN